MSFGLITCGVLACDQILGNGDFEVGSADAGDVLVDGPTITNPVDVVIPDETDAADATSDAALDAAAKATFPDGSVVWNGHAYQVIIDDSFVTWTQAFTDAKSRGGHLVTVTTAAENTFVVSLAIDAGGWPASNGPWIGAFQSDLTHEPDGGWVWVTGEPWSFTFWEDGEPNNQGGNENYAAYLDDPNAGQWNDFDEDGDEQVVSYVIEYE